ncbi:hypothetical protein QMW84_20380 [Cronobacter sakazakii]|jgi:hypothetical protein|uniref:Uncharacterized protein n=1 Tax=Salmonella enterica TaxID=28901 RepID=A0A756DJN2_SALER|nr:hypothetical protein [Salmonella enterica]ECA4425271.1 hypothetical protein [Salmonella enterica subsp. enterica serovar Anatum]ECE0404279.1 hypothetical protein [Salmonella enterica subsp. enterica]ECH8994487.1 hypothetical protein [Salmonella enterica subsp. enterica serovar Javiana]ECM1103123.1 hypothetical protein [Salmonella enterica subsp. enterica serovar Altona]ECT9325856.1 hypothetical protein [Salmonella enterica subsp. enterica serovar Infantis]ECU5334821.1 hypothetical protein 
MNAVYYFIAIYFAVMIFGSVCEKSVEKGGGILAKTGFSASLVFIKFSPILLIIYGFWIYAIK